ncbi:MAG: hypothetical protein GXY44_16365 [Phycisphaerales bacterium]|nr:hypothetical protein [Phycisphaerales bacterium]
MALKTNHPEPFEALTVVSPMCMGDEEKNQDRAYWFAPGAVAALCDGVTTSPLAAEAAELVSKSIPILFQGPVGERLRVLCDLLSARRMEAMRSDITPPKNAPPGLQEMLQEVAREKMARALQTTLVALSLTAGDELILADLVLCGGSAFFAFSPQQGLLTSSLGGNPEETSSAEKSRRIPFGPGDELLAKVVADGTRYPKLMRRNGIGKPDQWLLCKPLDRCGSNKSKGGLWLETDDLLLVPKYLAGTSQDPLLQGYRRFPFSKMIRVASDRRPLRPSISFNDRGAVTAVLPDHFYTGHWTHSQDRFPVDTHFVLASDGFYSCFENPDGLWQWLQSHEAALHQAKERQDLLARLHKQLHTKSSDDDISFIWICPRPSIGSRQANSTKEEPGHAR